MSESNTRRQRRIILAAAAVVVSSSALLLSRHRNAAPDELDSPLLPSLAADLDSVSSVSVFKGSPTPTVTVHKQGDTWTVAERGDYPADISKVRKLILALNDAKIREEKTSNPDNYAVIGVEDATKAGATGAQIELQAKSGKLDVIVGKPTGRGNFVRRAAEKTSYVAEPGISLESEPRFWIDTHLLDIDNEKIQSIELKPSAGGGYTLRRVTEPAKAPDAKAPDAKTPEPNTADASPAAAKAPAPKTADAKAPAAPPAPPPPPVTKWVLEGVPSGRKANDSDALAPLPSTFTSLTDEDVAKAGDIDFSKPTTLTVTMSDGSTVTMTGASVGDKRWIRVAAPKDAALTAKANGRAFEVASYRYDQMFRPLEQLLVPKPTPAAKPGAAGPPLPSAVKKPGKATKP